MHVRSLDDLELLDRRLSRIEGQVRGVRRMLSEERDCRDVVQQVSAVRAAVHQVGLELVRVYARQCLAERSGVETDDEALEYVIGTLGRWG